MSSFEFTKGCEHGDACPQCEHCLHSWHTKPFERITNYRTGERQTVRHCDLCDCELVLADQAERNQT